MEPNILDALVANEPITAVGLLDAALEGLQLPARGGRSIDDWAALITDPTAAYYISTAVSMFRRADYAVGRHWLQQAEQAFLRAPKPAAGDVAP